LVVVNIAPKVMIDPGYQATVGDIKSWERAHGPIPAGAVVMIRSDWSKKWGDPKRFTSPPFPGVSLDALEYLHLERHILMHGHEPLDTDNTAPEFVGEKWLLKHNFAQAEGVANLDQVPESGALIVIGFAKFKGGTGGFARYIAIAPGELAARRHHRRAIRGTAPDRMSGRSCVGPTACWRKPRERHASWREGRARDQ
jgi:kynurenine formamidase